MAIRDQDVIIDRPANLGDAVDPALSPRLEEARFERRRGGSFLGWIVAIALILVIGGIVWGYSGHRSDVATNNPPAATGTTVPGVAGSPRVITPPAATPATPQENTGSR